MSAPKSWHNRLLAVRKVDAVVLTHLPHIRWACGFSGSAGSLIVRASGLTLLTDARYQEQASGEVGCTDVRIGKGSLDRLLKRFKLLEGCRTAMVQAEHLTVHVYEQLQADWPDIKWKARPRIMREWIMSKSPSEFTKLCQAQSITDQAFEATLPLIRAGVTEQEIAASLDFAHRTRGANAMAFETIVASGPNSALPHARPGNRRLQVGDCVLVDCGCVVDGYTSDMTRCISIGPPSDRLSVIHRLVLEAHDRSVAKLRDGAEAQRVDAAAREIITAAGYGDYFVHSTGHGLGLEVHEPPRLSHESTDSLTAGMVVTIEPGVYLPNEFGVRFEDSYVIRPEGPERLTGTARELIVV